MAPRSRLRRHLLRRLAMAAGTVAYVGVAMPSEASATVAFQANTTALYLYTPSGGGTNTQGGMLAGTSPSITALASGGYQQAFQSNVGTLVVRGDAGFIDTHLGMASGTSPSIAASASGGYMVAFQANTGTLWTFTPAQGGVNTFSGMMAGTSPAITALTSGGYQEAFQANTSELMVRGDAGFAQTGIGMAAGTSPAIAASPFGGYKVAVQANTTALWTWSPSGGSFNTGSGMRSGTSPSIAALSGGGYQEAFQANTSELMARGDAGFVNTQAGLAAGTSPAIASSRDGSYRIAAQTNTTNLYTFSPPSSGLVTNLGMAGNSSPAISPDVIDTDPEADAFVSRFRSVSSDSAADALYTALLPYEAARVDGRMREGLTDGGIYRNVVDLKVWRMSGGRRHEIPSSSVASDLGFDWASAQRITSGALDDPQRPVGLPYTRGAGFLPTSQACTAIAMNADSQLGLAIPRPRFVLSDSVRREVFYGAVRCFRQMTTKPLILRMQVPVDLSRRVSNDANLGRWNEEFNAFAELVKERPGTTAIVTLRSGEMKDCASTSEIGGGWSGTLPECQFPTPELYDAMASATRALVESKLGTSVLYGSWNEPGHSGDGLRPGLSASNAAKKAGSYWKKLMRIVNDPARVLAGDFHVASQKARFLEGVNATDPTDTRTPTRWSLHPYGDFTAASDPFQDTNGLFGSTVAWLTEVGPALRMNGTNTNLANGYTLPNPVTPSDPFVYTARQAQYVSGTRLRGRLAGATTPTKVAIYTLVPPAYNNTNDDLFDSAIADRAGKARPFVCGLAALPTEGNCVGNDQPQTTNVP